MRTHMLRPYFALFKQHMIAQVQFRFAFWSKIMTNFFWGYVRAVIILTFFVHGTGSADIDLRQAIGIVWLSQIAMNLLPGFGMDFAVWEKIRSGSVSYELLRPIDIYAHWFSSALAVKIAPFLMALAPIAGGALLIPGELGLALPASLPNLLAFFITLCSGTLLSGSLICFGYAMMMDVRVGQRVSMFLMIMIQILSGAYLPLQLWPEWMQGFLFWQPFAGAMDLPLRFYVGSAAISSLPVVLGIQLAWTAVITLTGRAWINRNLTKLVIQGG